MDINILAFGIAKDILGGSSVQFNIDQGGDIEALKKKMITVYPDFLKLASFSVAVNQEYQEDTYVLSEQDEVAIIPPVSGG
jgi:molybdopterin synthase sulfur carrier subunit